MCEIDVMVVDSGSTGLGHDPHVEIGHGTAKEPVCQVWQTGHQ